MHQGHNLQKSYSSDRMNIPGGPSVGSQPPLMYGEYNPQMSNSYDRLDEPLVRPVPPPRLQTLDIDEYSLGNNNNNGFAAPAGPRRNMTPVQGDPYHDVFGSDADNNYQNSPGYSNSYYADDKKQYNFPDGSTGSSSPSPSRRGFEDNGVRTNLGNTSFVMAILSEFWLFNIFFILGGTFMMTFYVPQFYIDDKLWNDSCYWKLAWIFPLPYTIICFLGLALPFRTPKFIYSDSLPRRRCDNLYILTVTKGDNKEVF
jgi:hypothetical protein